MKEKWSLFFWHGDWHLFYPDGNHSGQFMKDDWQSAWDIIWSPQFNK